MTHPAAHDLTALAYGLIESPERDELLEHIAHCATCRADYDAVFNEQALVREALVDEIRPNLAQARALKNVLAGLERLDGARPRLRLGRGALEVAAALVIGAGLFALSVAAPARPSPETKAAKTEAPKPDVVTLGTVSDGRVLARDERGALVEVRELPVSMDLYVGDKPALVTLANGTRLDLDEHSLFRIEAMEASGTQTRVRLTRGAGRVRAGSEPQFVTTSVARLGALPKAEFRITAGESAAQFSTQVFAGSVVWNLEGESAARNVMLANEYIEVQEFDVRSQRVPVARVRFEGREFDLPLDTVRKVAGPDGVQIFVALDSERLFTVMDDLQPEERDVFMFELKLTDVMLPAPERGVRATVLLEIEDDERGVRVRDGDLRVLFSIDGDNVRAELGEGEAKRIVLAPSLKELGELEARLKPLLPHLRIETRNGKPRVVRANRFQYHQQIIPAPRDMPEPRKR